MGEGGPTPVVGTSNKSNGPEADLANGSTAGRCGRLSGRRCHCGICHGAPSTCWMMASRRAASLDSSRSVNWTSSFGEFGGPSVSDLRQF